MTRRGPKDPWRVSAAENKRKHWWDRLTYGQQIRYKQKHPNCKQIVGQPGKKLRKLK
jgi:hypothetical protein